MTFDLCIIDWVAISAIGTFLAVIVALFIPFVRDYNNDKKIAQALRRRTSLTLWKIKEEAEVCLESKGDSEFILEIIDIFISKSKKSIDELKINIYALEKLSTEEQDLFMQVIFYMDVLSLYVDNTSKMMVVKKIASIADSLLNIYKKNKIKSVENILNESI